MTLQEVLKKVLTLIEEYDKTNETNFTNDPDIENILDNVKYDSVRYTDSSNRFLFEDMYVTNISTDILEISNNIL